MTNITKTTTPEYYSTRRELCKILAKHSGTELEVLLSALLTESEERKIIKRFGAILLFEKGYSRYRISKTLALDESTVSRLYVQFSEGAYAEIRETLSPTEMNGFLRFFDTLLKAQADPKARAKIMRGTW